jgi:hypothetical protein
LYAGWKSCQAESALISKVSVENVKRPSGLKPLPVGVRIVPLSKASQAYSENPPAKLWPISYGRDEIVEKTFIVGRSLLLHRKMKDWERQKSGVQESLVLYDPLRGARGQVNSYQKERSENVPSVHGFQAV